MPAARRAWLSDAIALRRESMALLSARLMLTTLAFVIVAGARSDSLLD